MDVLQRPLSPGNSESLTATANYSKAVHQVLDVVHEVLHHQRRLESIWQHRKVRLHQRLQLCVFQQDVQQVMTLLKEVKNGLLFADIKIVWYLIWRILPQPIFGAQLCLCWNDAEILMHLSVSLSFTLKSSVTPLIIDQSIPQGNVTLFSVVNLSQVSN